MPTNWHIEPGTNKYTQKSSPTQAALLRLSGRIERIGQIRRLDRSDQSVEKASAFTLAHLRLGPPTSSPKKEICVNLRNLRIKTNQPSSKRNLRESAESADKNQPATLKKKSA
ncbi:MAG: hypothetical protein ACOX9E_06410 [Lentisphaeria bacterium]|jgi:hypothetical protein